VVTRQPQVKRRTAKVRLSETDVLPLYNATNQQVLLGERASKTINFGGQEVKGQRHTRPKIDLEASFLTPLGRVVF